MIVSQWARISTANSTALWLWKVTMRLRPFAGVVTAITLLVVPTYGMAAGSNMHNTWLSHASAAATPAISPSELKWGCGTHRHYDRKSQKCRSS